MASAAGARTQGRDLGLGEGLVQQGREITGAAADLTAAWSGMLFQGGCQLCGQTPLDQGKPVIRGGLAAEIVS